MGKVARISPGESSGGECARPEVDDGPLRDRLENLVEEVNEPGAGGVRAGAAGWAGWEQAAEGIGRDTDDDERAVKIRVGCARDGHHVIRHIAMRLADVDRGDRPEKPDFAALHVVWPLAVNVVVPSGRQGGR